MFSRATKLRFGSGDTLAPLARGYAELRAAAATIPGDEDVDTLTEVLWSGLHGLVVLERDGRLRSAHHGDRIQLFVTVLGAAPPPIGA